MNIKTVNVLLNHYGTELPVGKLAYKEKRIYFEYDQEFLKRGIELSPYKLPLKSGLFVCDDKVFEGLYGLFGDSMPDGWGRLLLDRHFLKNGVSYSEITPLDRLSYIGLYGTGALRYEPVIESSKDERFSDVNLDLLSSGSMEILKGASENMLDDLLSLGGSSAGARPKVMIQLSDDQKSIIHGSNALKGGFTHWMVKFASSLDTQEIGKTEYAYALMAKDAKVIMSETTLLRTKNNAYFATKRYDRDGDHRVHCHSVAGLTHSDFRVPTLDYDDLLGLTLHLSRDVNELVKMFRLAVFNLYTHNRDDHAKNFAFYLSKDNRWRLTPAYDLTFSYGPGGEHSTTYLGEGKSPSSSHLMRLAEKHNIKNAERIIDEIKSVVRDFSTYAKSVGLKENSTKSINDTLQGLMR